MQFLNPILLSALALAAVPLIIHLLNRRRFQMIDWAPMKYLKLTLRTNRRRLRLEQWLLLLVRTLVVAVLIFAVARPVVSPTGLGVLLVSHARTSRVVIIDDSLSMGYRTNGRSAFELAKDAAVELVKTIGVQDSLTVHTTSALDEPLARDTHPQNTAPLVNLIRGLELSHTSSRWAAAFRIIDEDITAATFPVRELTIITDLRRHGWNGEEIKPFTSKWAGQSVTMRLIDVGSRETANIRITDLRQEDPLPLPGAVIKLSAEVRNDQATAVPPMHAILAVDDQRRPIMLPELPANAATRVPITVRFDKPGSHTVSLTLEERSDALPEDNARCLSVQVRERLNIVLLDGEPGSQPFESETDFLALALTAGSDAWHIERVTDPAWLTAPRADALPDMLVLANIAALSPEQTSSLEQLVQRGVGLMIFPGDQTDATAWNDRLFRKGAGLLPAQLESVVDEPVTGLVIEKLEQSPLEPLAYLSPEALTRIHARRTLGVTPAVDDHAVRVLARWNDAQGRPAVLEKSFGKGRVILFTVTADRQWSDWPIDPTYVLATRSAATTLARGVGPSNELTPGQPLEAHIEGSDRLLEPVILLPGDEANQPLLLETREGESSLRHSQTRRAGIYTMKWKDALSRPHHLHFAVNPDPAESELESIDEPQFIAMAAPLKPVVIHQGAPAIEPSQHGREVWRTAVITLLCLMIFESLLAVWVGRER